MSTKASRLLGDRVQKAQTGEKAELWIYSAYAKDHWAARKAGDLTHAEHPGTAVQMGEDLYEVVLAEETAEIGYVVRYGLRKWEPQHALRGVIPYSPETQAQAAADYLEEADKQALRSRMLWLFPLAGMAPDPVQRDWEAKTALNMTVVAAGSALTQILVFMSLVQSFGSSPAGGKLTYAIEYIGFDAFVRLLYIVITGRPRGVFVLTLPYLLWDGIVHPEKRARKKQFEIKFSLEPDEIIRRPGTGHLVVRSMLFDETLSGLQPIRFEGAVYKPLNWHREGKGLERRWVYEFGKIDGDPKVKYQEYTQPRNPQWQKSAEDMTRALDRAHMFALLWGTYPAAEQSRLEAKYQFPAVQMTAVTAGLILVAGAIQAWAMRLLGAPVLTYVASLYFVLESLFRLYVSKAQAQPAGSLAGWILGLFVSPPR